MEGKQVSPMSKYQAHTKKSIGDKSSDHEGLQTGLSPILSYVK